MRSQLQPSILLVGDDLLLKGGVKDYLNRRGIAATLVKQPSEAETKLNESAFDVIITRLNLPDASGLNFIQRVRSSNPSQVLMVVGQGLTPKELEDILNMGASDLLEEPFDSEDLEDRIRRIWSPETSKRKWSVANYLVEGTCKFEFFSREVTPSRLATEVVESSLVAPHIERSVQLRVILALQEAITNSLDHGNLELDSAWKDETLPTGEDRYSLEKARRLADPSYGGRALSFEVSLSGKSVIFTITDSGKGFLEKAKVYQGSDSLLPYGRGLAIMRAVMDEVSFHDAGRKVRMVKVFG